VGELPPEPPDDARRQGLRQALAEYFKNQAAQMRLQFPEPRDRPGHVGQPQRPLAGGQAPAPSRPWSQAGTPAAAEAFAAPVAPTMPPARSIAAEAPPAAPLMAPAASPVPGESLAPAAGRPQVLQVHGTYLILAEADGITIVDQHALHERILYNQLLRRVSAGSLESQHLLVPAVLAVTPVQQALLTEQAELLGRLGIELSDFGPGKLAIQRFPSFLDKLDPAAFLADLADQLAEEDPSLDRERLLHQILDMMACKAAVKAGDSLTGQEIESLLDQREHAEKSTACPHGRPTQIRLTIRDLEKQFKRG
jgi:DNA mismatch repair protein MutL